MSFYSICPFWESPLQQGISSTNKGTSCVPGCIPRTQRSPRHIVGPPQTFVRLGSGWVKKDTRITSHKHLPTHGRGEGLHLNTDDFGFKKKKFELIDNGKLDSIIVSEISPRTWGPTSFEDQLGSRGAISPVTCQPITSI